MSRNALGKYVFASGFGAILSLLAAMGLGLFASNHDLALKIGMALLIITTVLLIIFLFLSGRLARHETSSEEHF